VPYRRRLRSGVDGRGADDRRGNAGVAPPVDPTLRLIPPVHSDCGLNLRIGRNVVVNQGCRLDDIGGISLGDDVTAEGGERGLRRSRGFADGLILD
jgi:acetyltransferase-like isoleucine patch superfamily enzyme